MISKAPLGADLYQGGRAGSQLLPAYFPLLKLGTVFHQIQGPVLHS